MSDHDTHPLAAALVEAQKEMPSVQPDAKANYGAYVTLDHLIAKTRPVLNKHGLAITQFPTVLDHGQPALRTILSHTSGESLQADTPLFLSKQDMQAFGAAITYARRYAWASVLGISDQEDDDGNRASAPTKTAPASAGATQVRGDTAKGQSPAAAVAGDDPVTAGLHKRILELAKEFGSNVVTVNKSIRDNQAKNEGYLRRHHEWCERQIATLEQNVADKKAQAEAEKKFPIPDSAKKEAA